MRRLAILVCCALVAPFVSSCTCRCGSDDDESPKSDDHSVKAPKRAKATVDAAAAPTNSRVKTDDYSIDIPTGYRRATAAELKEQGSPLSDVLLVAEKKPDVYTANTLISAPPPAMKLESVVAQLGEDGERQCQELAEAFASSARAATSPTGKKIAVSWGETCQVEVERPSFGATALTTIMRTRAGYVVVIGHFGIGDDRARAAYTHVLDTWRL